jgi:pantetheine-phosphate adenylyltransferase
VVVAVASNPNKNPLFPVSKRIEQIRSCTGHLDNIEIEGLDGLTVHYAEMRQAQVLLRGLRVLSDFEMELQMAHLNKTLSSQIETVFLATNNEYSFLSSSAVKEIAKFGGSVDRFVPPSVALDIYKCYARTQPESNLNPTEPPLKTNPPPMESP